MSPGPLPDTRFELVLVAATLVLLAAGIVAVGYACWRVRLRAGIPLVACALISTFNRTVWWLGLDQPWLLWARATWLPLVMSALFLATGLLLISDIDLIVVRRRPRARRRHA